MKFKHPQNDFVENISCPWLWVLLFGCFYLLIKGFWKQLFFCIIMVIITLLIAFPLTILFWIIYPLFINGIIRKSYLRNGWSEVD